MSQAPSVSVVIPTYNRASVIGRAIRSVLAQTRQDFEILVVDDGSTDDTRDLVAALRDDRIRYLASSATTGASAARNRGIEGARAPIVAFLDSDDEWLPLKLERQLECFREADPRTGVVYCRLSRHDDVKDRPILEPPRRQRGWEGDLYWRLLTGWHPPTPTLIAVRREALLGVGGFDTALRTAEDYDLWLRLARAGHRFALVDEVLAVKHERAGLQLMRNPAARRSSERLLDQRWGPVIQSRLGPRAYRRWRERRRLGLAAAYFDRVCTASGERDRAGALAAVWRMVRLLPASRSLLLPGLAAALGGPGAYAVARGLRRSFVRSVVARVHLDDGAGIPVDPARPPDRAARADKRRRSPPAEPATIKAVRAVAPPSRPEGKTFVFICGLHRSGTSLLFEMLREHPQISGFWDTGVPEDEGQHLQTVYPSAGTHGMPGRFGFKREAHLTEASPLVTPANREKLFTEWSVLWDGSRPFLLEKSPPNLVRTRFLQAMFPRSKFIVFRRHPVPVSLATRRWSQTSLFSLVRHWVVCHEIWAADRPHVRDVLEVTYEDLVSAPAETLDRICRFLGAEPYSSPLPQKVDPTLNAHYLSTWRILRQRPRSWPSVTLAERVFERRIRRWGYSFRTAAESSPPDLPR